jgi:plastocyanin domain-containing protein
MNDESPKMNDESPKMNDESPKMNDESSMMSNGSSMMSGGSYGKVRSYSDVAVMIDGVQVVNSTLEVDSYPNITVKVGTAVKWIIDAPEGSIGYCNDRVNVDEYGIKEYPFKLGENVIEFMPDEVGQFTYSCWMDMIHATITVEE